MKNKTSLVLFWSTWFPQGILCTIEQYELIMLSMEKLEPEGFSMHEAMWVKPELYQMVVGYFQTLNGVLSTRKAG